MADHIPTPFTADPDVSIIRAMAQGDVHALDDLYARYGPGVLSYLTGYLDNRAVAEEVLQDVMLAAWENASRFRGESKVRTWLLVIARNRAINMQRKHAPRQVSIEDHVEFASGDTTPLERVERKSQRAMMRDALNRLESAHREILDLVFYHQLSGQEVADVLGISVGTVKSRLHRAKESLRRTLQIMGETSNA